MLDPELSRRVAALVDGAGPLVRVSPEAEKLAVFFPETSKAEICAEIIAVATQAGRGVELENLSDAEGRWPAEIREIIKRRAYEIWEEQGRPPGRADEHWLLAEREITGADR